MTDNGETTEGSRTPEEERKVEPPELPEPPEPVEPADLPRGLFTQIDYLLRHSERVIESARLERELWPICRALFVISMAMAAVYGAVMGGSNLLQNSVMPFDDKMLMILIVAIKVPMLFLLTLGIVLPPIYVSNAFIAPRIKFGQILTVLLMTTAITTTILASMATVAFFFALTSANYHFIKLLHVVFFAYAGVVGLMGFEKAMRRVSQTTRRHAPKPLFWVWFLLYMFVGAQLGWVLRPFVGAPNLELTLFRERKGNFYESVVDSVRNLDKGRRD